MKRIILTCMMSISISLLGSVPAMAAADNEDIIAEDRQQKSTEIYEETKEQEIEVQDILPDSEELFEGYMDQELYAEAQAAQKSTRARSRRSTLSDKEQRAYDILKEKISQVADGRLSSTEFQIPVRDIFGEEIQNGYSAQDLGVSAISSGGRLTNAASQALNEKTNLNLASIIRCLIADCPYEFYWYDKTAGVSYSFPRIDSSVRGDKAVLKVSENAAYRMNFCVASEYAAGSTARTFRADTSKTGAVTAAVAKAAAIVNRYTYENDYNKLCDYRKEICNLTSYNNAAARSSTQYGNPWQMIWVFDDDPSTNVVCEGYAKAFQYLCDLSDFKSDKVECHTVTGTMSGGTGAGGHMWNIVTMDDGRNYLADVTNCDSGSVGADDKLFLAVPVSGALSDGYTFRAGSAGIRYIYDNDTKGLFEADILTLSGQAYDPQNPTDDGAVSGETPKPSAPVTEAPKPETTVAPKPDTTEVPKPDTTETPKPDTTEAPKPEITEAPKPETTEVPKPEVTETPTPNPKPATRDNCPYNLLQAQAKTVTKTSIKVTWKKVKGADGYIVYGCSCGKGNKLKKLKTTTATAYTHRNLKKGAYYKYQVKAYKKTGNKKTILAVSKEVYAATSGGKAENCKAVKLRKSSISLKKGKTCTLKATQVPMAKELKVKEKRKLTFESSNCKVATVTSNGKIKAIGKGKCTIYAYAQNGICAKATVTVK